MHGKVSFWWIVLLVIWFASLTTKTFCWNHCKMNFPYRSFWVLYFFFDTLKTRMRHAFRDQPSYPIAWDSNGPDPKNSEPMRGDDWGESRDFGLFLVIARPAFHCIDFSVFCGSPTRIFSFQFTNYACNKAYFE